MGYRWWLLAAACGLLWASVGCVNVQAPERVELRAGHRPEPVDSSHVPATQSHEECRAELVKAYENIRYLEGENEHLRDKLAECKRDRERYKDELKACEKRHEKRRDKHDDD